MKLPSYALRLTTYERQAAELLRLAEPSFRRSPVRSVATDRRTSSTATLGFSNWAVKASREIKMGEKVAIRRGAITLEIDVVDLPKSRVGPKLVADYIIDATPKEELEKLEVIRMERRDMPSMKGRPTKKNRREWKRWMG